MLDDFFYYTKSERRAILFLSILFVIMLSGGILSSLYKSSHSSGQMSLTDSVRIDSFYHQKKSKSGQYRNQYTQNVRKEKSEGAIKIVLQPFDPNTADSMALLKVGMPPFVVRNLIRYRERGGYFRDAASLSKIYGLDTDLFVRLKPYVRINSFKRTEKYKSEPQLLALKNEADVLPKTDTVCQVFPKQFKYAPGTVIDLNKADTSELKKVPGIGSYLAGKIVAYRNRLGGYVSVRQLQEIKHVRAELNKWFTVGNKPFRFLEVNRMGLDALRSHPYMDFYKARVILEFRRKRGEIKSLSQLSMFEEFTEKDLEKLSPYLKFD